MAARHGRLFQRQRQAVGHPQLLDHEVEPAGFLRHRVLDLQPGVYLEEGDRARGAEQELDRAGADVAGFGADVACRGVDAFALALVEEGRGRFLHQLLVASLQRAVARAQHQHVAVRVGDHLGLDVARLVEELLDKAFASTEGRDGLAHRRFVELGHLVQAPRDLHAAPAAAEGRLDDDGQAMLPREGLDLGRVLHRAGGALDQRRADLQRDAPRLDLVAQPRDGRRRRADPGEAGVDHGLREAGVLRQETVAGVHRIGAAAAGHVEQLVDGQVGVGGAVALQPPGLVGHACVQGIDVGVGIHGHRLHAVVGAGTGDAHGDLAAVGDQDFLHGVFSVRDRWARSPPRPGSGCGCRRGPVPPGPGARGRCSR
ncbi:Uncharacterised protein [Xylophilus ampelinus]|nr:Uncharacterised protein [Xylophilus ampelinus]